MNINLISPRFVNDGVASLSLSPLQKEYIELFENKCRCGEYSLKNRTCECGHDDFEVIAQKDRYGIGVDTVICKNCGLIMTNPCLDDKSNNDFYKNDYPYIYRAETKPSEDIFKNSRDEAEQIITFIRKHTGMTEGRVLEIGCADGRNVIAFAENGYDACGIDLSKEYVDFGKDKGLNLFCEDSETFEKRGLKFDLIILNHVLEHLIDLDRDLSIIHKMLNPNGRLYVGVPGVKALSLGEYKGDFLLMLQNAHVFNFTKTTLCRVMKKYGFDAIFCNEGVYGIFEKGDRGVIDDNVYADTIQYLRRIERISGDRGKLLFDRVNDIVRNYGKGEVLLYGTAMELDGFVQNIEDLSPIRGFFYTDKKTPGQVVEYVQALTNELKCILVIDATKNDSLLNEFADRIKGDEISVYSAYTDLY